jgi:hypothetical protein
MRKYLLLLIAVMLFAPLAFAFSSSPKPENGHPVPIKMTKYEVNTFKLIERITSKLPHSVKEVEELFSVKLPPASANFNSNEFTSFYQTSSPYYPLIDFRLSKNKAKGLISFTLKPKIPYSFVKKLFGDDPKEGISPPPNPNPIYYTYTYRTHRISFTQSGGLHEQGPPLIYQITIDWF